MADLVKYKYGTEAQILALTPSDSDWVERAFYYPTDVDYFYQAFEGVMKPYGTGLAAGVGVKLNGKVLGGVKTLIEEDDTLTIPANHDYNTYALDVDGIVNCDGQINTL